MTGITQAAALLFFAFAGYARIATLGEEVREPARTIPLAIPLALGIVVVIYAVVGAAALAAVGPATLARSAAPLAAAAQSGALSRLTPVVRIGGAIGLSSFAILAYYAITNAASFTLPGRGRRWRHPLAVLGVTGCAVLALTLPRATVVTGAAVLIGGLVGRAGRTAYLRT